MDDFQFLTLKCARDNVDFDYELEISNKEYAILGIKKIEEK